MKNGFSLMELMIVVAIIAVLAMISVPTFTRYLAKAKRAEAYMNLRSLYGAEKAHWAEHGTYSTVCSGNGGIGWRPEGTHNYTYGFPGAEGVNNFTGKLNTASANLSAGNAGKDTFVAVAAGDIRGNGKPDIITIDQDNTITVVQDALAQ